MTRAARARRREMVRAVLLDLLAGLALGIVLGMLFLLA